MDYSKLTADEKMDLKEMLSHSGMKGLYKTLHLLVQSAEQKVITTPLSGDATALIHEKARAEGAKALVANLKLHLTSNIK